jgi:hypothetical protein
MRILSSEDDSTISPSAPMIVMLSAFLEVPRGYQNSEVKSGCRSSPAPCQAGWWS